MAGHFADRALNAVRRVKSSREQDSRIGLSQAIAAAASRDAEAVRATEQRVSAPAFGTGAPADFQSYVSRVSGLVDRETQAMRQARDSRMVAEEAERRWQYDRKDLATVDMLLERRGAARAQERARREERELDTLATQAWLRRWAANQVDGPDAPAEGDAPA